MTLQEVIGELLKLECSGETLIDAISELIKVDLYEQDHKLIRSCLEGAINHLSDASLAVYASYK